MNRFSKNFVDLRAVGGSNFRLTRGRQGSARNVLLHQMTVNSKNSHIQSSTVGVRAAWRDKMALANALGAICNCLCKSSKKTGGEYLAKKLMTTLGEHGIRNSGCMKDGHHLRSLSELFAELLNI